MTAIYACFRECPTKDTAFLAIYHTRFSMHTLFAIQYSIVNDKFSSHQHLLYRDNLPAYTPRQWTDRRRSTWAENKFLLTALHNHLGHLLHVTTSSFQWTTISVASCLVRWSRYETRGYSSSMLLLHQHHLSLGACPLGSSIYYLLPTSPECNDDDRCRMIFKSALLVLWVSTTSLHYIFLAGCTRGGGSCLDKSLTNAWSFMHSYEYKYCNARWLPAYLSARHREDHVKAVLAYGISLYPPSIHTYLNRL